MVALVHFTVCSFTERSDLLVVAEFCLTKLDWALNFGVCSHAFEALIENDRLLVQVLAYLEVERVLIISHGVNSSHLVVANASLVASISHRCVEGSLLLLVVLVHRLLA